MRKLYQTVSQILGDILGVPADLLSPARDVSRLTYQERAAAAIACERAFHLELEDERVAELETVEDWTNYVRQRAALRAEDSPAPTDAQRESWYYQ